MQFLAASAGLACMTLVGACGGVVAVNEVRPSVEGSRKSLRGAVPQTSKSHDGRQQQQQQQQQPLVAIWLILLSFDISGGKS